MPYRASAHAVYDLKYPIVWAPKYRKDVLVGEVAQTVETLFRQIAEAYDMEIDTMEVMEDHVHLFLSAPLCSRPDCPDSQEHFRPRIVCPVSPITPALVGW
jgi:REP element-mobilizing transposase RayT